MAEQFDVTAPVARTTTSWQLSFVGLDLANNRVTILLTSNTGETITKFYDGTTVPSGSTVLHLLNIANFSVNSFAKVVYTQLRADGIIQGGSVSGIPQ